MIKRLQNKTILKGRNVFFDRLCTSIPLIHLLLSQGITSIRTLMLTGREYLKKSRPYAVKTRPTQGGTGKETCPKFVHCYDQEQDTLECTATLHRPVMQPLLGTTKDDKQEKLAVYNLYDFTKGERIS